MQPAQCLPAQQLQSRSEQLQKQLSEAQHQQQVMERRVAELFAQKKALETAVQQLEEQEVMFAAFRNKVKEQVTPTLSGDQSDKETAIQEAFEREMFKLLGVIIQIGTIDSEIEEIQHTLKQQRKANQKMIQELGRVDATLAEITKQRKQLEAEVAAAQDSTDMLTQTAQVLDTLPES